jgi:methylmalonyl-CoA mutase N-terminal domain/subunit
VLQSVGGVDAARRVAGVEGVDITVARGQEVVPLPEGNRYLGFIFASGADQAAAVSSLRAAHALLDPVIE